MVLLLKSIVRMRTYQLSRQKNIRDLGGLPGLNGKHIKYGRLFRGGALHRVNEEDVPILESFHLTDVVDFRGDDEFFGQPDYHLPGVIYHNFPAIQEKVNKEDIKQDDGNLIWFVREGVKGHDHMIKQYENLIIDEKSQIAYRNFFKVLMKEGAVTYYHCSQGKDRAGLASYFIETILGVDYEIIKEDYLLSNVAMKERVERIFENIKYKKFYNPTYHQSLLDVFSAKLEYLEAAIKVIDERYGGTINYIKNILCVDIDKFRKMYLE